MSAQFIAYEITRSVQLFKTDGVDGIEAVLLDREGETLVLVVTPAQAARAATWNVGDIVRTDDRGRFHDHRTVEPDLDEDLEQGRQQEDWGR